MEFWTENQGQPHLNSKFNTVPGRNWTHGHHDRHHATHYPVYYRDQQDQSNYWAPPGPRSGGKLHEYRHWTDPQLTSSSSQFPFILDRHPQNHKEQVEYQQQQVRNKDWANSQRDFERGFLREGWQGSWEPSSPVHSNREFSAKRSENSYRELEAWAARYSHSLPRRRRLEAELRGASQGLVESRRVPERQYRSGVDFHETAHVQQNPNRLSELWDRSSRQASVSTPTQAPDTSFTLEMKENTRYQKRMFGQPPGYIAPPPYDNPHKCYPPMQQSDITLEPGGNKHPIRKQEDYISEQDKKRNKKDESKSGLELGNVKTQRQETGATQTEIQITHLQSEYVLASQHPKGQDPNIYQQTSSKIIEGRKFKLNKKMGGMTIFCLVSRTVAEAEAPSLLLRPSNINIQSTDGRKVSDNQRATNEVSKVDKLADEVDFTSLTEQICASLERNLTAAETPSSTRSEELDDSSPNKVEVDKLIKKTNMNDEDVTFKRETGPSVQPVFAKYPLWREPSSTSRAETQSSPISCSTANTGEKQSGDDSIHDKRYSDTHPTGTGTSLQSDTDTKNLAIAITSAPTKEPVLHPPNKHVQDVDSSSIDDPIILSSELNYQLNQDTTTDQDVEQMTEGLDTDLDSINLNKEETNEESEVCTCNEPSSSSEWETLEARAERILGISLHDLLAKEKPPNPPEEQTEESFSVQTQDITELHNPSKLSQTEEADISSLVTNEHGDAFAFSGEVVDVSKDKYTKSQIDTNKASPENKDTNDSHLQSPFAQEQTPDDALLDESSSTPTDLCDTFSFSALDLNLPCPILQTGTEKDPEKVEITNLPSRNQTSPPSLEQLPSSDSSESTDSLSTFTHHADNLTNSSPSLPDLTSNVVSSAEDEKDVYSNDENRNSEVEGVTEDVLRQNPAFHQSDGAAQITDVQQNENADEKSDNSEQKLATFPGTIADVLLQKHDFPQTESATNSEKIEEHQETDESSCVSTVEALETDELVDDLKDILLFPQQIDSIQSLCCVTEDQSQTNPDEVAGDLVEQKLGQKEATGFKAEKEIPQDPETQTVSPSLPETFDCEVFLLDEQSLSEQPSPPHQSDPEFDPLTTPPQQQQSCGDATLFSFSSLTNTSLLSPPSTASPPEEENASLCLPKPAAHREEPQYPKALWDVVNRIRKHTAPDSEDEDEEVCELWDLDSVPEGFNCPDVDVNCVKSVGETEHQGDDTEMRHIEKDGEEAKRHPDEDTLSYSSVDSEDTVIVAEEELNGATTEETVKSDEKNEDQCCSGEVENKAETMESVPGCLSVCAASAVAEKANAGAAAPTTLAAKMIGGFSIRRGAVTD